MISPSQIKKGIAITFNNESWLVVDFQHVNPGKGSAFVRTRLKGITNGKVLDRTFKTSEKLEEASMQYRILQYLYSDENNFYFMDDSYAELSLPFSVVGDRKNYLIEQAQVDGIFVDDEFVEIGLPKKMQFKVIEAPPGIKGDSANAGTKFVVIETGANVAAPLFINEGDIIKVNTETGEYCERVKA